LLDLQIIDEIILEPLGGAHRDKNFMLKNIRESLTKNLENFKLMSSEEIYNNRKNKFLKIGRNKGFISNLEDLSSLKSDNKNLNQILKSKKAKVIGLSVILASMILLFYLL